MLHFHDARGTVRTASQWPEGPPTGHRDSHIPPKRRMTLATLMPPPPASWMALPQRSLWVGCTRGVAVARSTDGFMVRHNTRGAEGAGWPEVVVGMV